MKVKFTVELDLSSPAYEKFELEKLATECLKARKELHGSAPSLESLIEHALMWGSVPHIASNLKWTLNSLNNQLNERSEDE